MIAFTPLKTQFKIGDRIQLTHGSIGTLVKIDHKGYWIRGNKKRPMCFTDCNGFTLIPTGVNEVEFANKSWRDRVVIIGVKPLVILDGVRIEDEFLEDFVTVEIEE